MSSHGIEIAELRRHMARLPDEMLLDIVLRQRRQYRPVALEVAEAEVRRRGLTPALRVGAQAGSLPGLKRGVARSPRSGQDMISLGCLGMIGFFFLFCVTANSHGFSDWFWPGFWGWVLLPLVLSALFGAAGWLLSKLRRRP